jgi:hypothetical protein
MNTLTYTPEAASAIRSLAVGQLSWSLNHAVTTFEAVPEDKLDYKPSDTAKSARELIQHLLYGNGMMLGGFGVECNPAEGSADRADLIDRLKSSTEQLVAKFEAVPDEAMDTIVPFLSGMPMPRFLMAASWHMARHAGHSDYLQTIWGDMEDHF